MQKYLYLTISDFHDFTTRHNGKSKTLDTLQDISEEVYEWQIESGYNPGYDIKLSDCYYDIDDAYQYLSKQTGLTIVDLKKKYSEQIEEDFRRSLNDAYWQSYEDEWISKFYSMIYDAVIETLDQFKIKANTMYLAIDGKKTKYLFNGNWHIPLDTECNQIAVPITRQELLEIAKDSYYYNPSDGYYSHEELCDVAHDVIVDNKTIAKAEHVDYYGSLGDSDNWLELFKEYNETEHIIHNTIKDHLTKVKQYIKNSVGLNYREASI